MTVPAADKNNIAKNRLIGLKHAAIDTLRDPYGWRCGRSAGQTRFLPDRSMAYRWASTASADETSNLPGASTYTPLTTP